MTFYYDVLRKDPRFRSPNICKDLALLEPEFREKLMKFVRGAEARGHVVEVLETFRSQARQMHLFDQGLTHLRNVGTHGFGLAADLGIMLHGRYDPRGADYLWFADLAERCDIISGINWGEPRQSHSFKDYDHLQGVPLFRQDELFAGRWYPPAGYSPWKDEEAHHIAGA